MNFKIVPLKLRSCYAPFASELKLLEYNNRGFLVLLTSIQFPNQLNVSFSPLSSTQTLSFTVANRIARNSVEISFSM